MERMDLMLRVEPVMQMLLAQQDHKVSVGSQVQLDLQDQPVLQDLLVQVEELLAQQVQLVQRVRQEHLVLREVLGQLALQVQQAQLV